MCCYAALRYVHICRLMICGNYVCCFNIKTHINRYVLFFYPVAVFIFSAIDFDYPAAGRYFYTAAIVPYHLRRYVCLLQMYDLLQAALHVLYHNLLALHSIFVCLLLTGLHNAVLLLQVLYMILCLALS